VGALFSNTRERCKSRKHAGSQMAYNRIVIDFDSYLEPKE